MFSVAETKHYGCYKSYISNHREWEKEVAKLENKVKRCKSKKSEKKLKHKLYRLKKRELSPPTVTKFLSSSTSVWV